MGRKQGVPMPTNEKLYIEIPDTVAKQGILKKMPHHCRIRRRKNNI